MLGRTFTRHVNSGAKLHAGGWRAALRHGGRRQFASGRAGAGAPPSGGGGGGPPRGPVGVGVSGPDGGGDGAGASAPLWWRGLHVCAGVAVATGVSVAALPSALSTQWGLQQAMELINQRMPGRVEVAEAQLSWSGGNELSCVKVYDSPRGGQILLHLNKVSTAASLWQLLTGSRGFNLIISKPWINAIYDTRVGDFKLITWAEKVGLLNAPPPPPSSSQQPSRQQPHQGQAAAGSSASSGAASAAASAAAHGKPGDQGPGAQKPGGLVEVLGRINSKMDLSADVRLGRLNLVVADAMLLVPEEVRQILGPSVHITGAIGEQCLREWAEEVGEDASWALGAATSPTSSRAAGGAAASVASVSQAGPEAVAVRPPAEVLRRPRDYKPGVMQVNSAHLVGEMRLWDGPDHTLLHQPATARLDLTPALTRLGLAAANPLLDAVVTVQGGAGGAGGRLSASFSPDGGRLPYQAATVEMAPVTLALGPASNLVQLLSDLGLRGLTGRGASPGASFVSLSRMSVHFTRGGELRTQRVDMRLGGSTSSSTSSSVGTGSHASSTSTNASSDSAPAPGAGAGAGSAAPESSAGASVAAPAPAPAPAATLPAEPAGSGGVRLAVWGRADLMTDSLDFTVGVAPGPLLTALGLPSGERQPASTEADAAAAPSSSSTGGSSRDLTLLPEGYMVLVPVTGPTSAPRYDVAGAAMRLGQLGARQKAAQWAERRQRKEGHEREGHERGDGHDGDGGGSVRRGLAAGLGALVNAVAPPQELVAAIDTVLQEDLRRVPPPLPPLPSGRSVA
ncbi:hypothetical protein HYH02_007967 [Chlamydomonas schloesseri]|uniref:Uncharacterized protein n=1 Tax=Chlamydomonas schloesseri TaxID=2026947 RepID=A0A835WGY5_9CHLO|nr:hypothetical protein HYH02_007967 [Chlamydomonas schloesseri]|eukprot:KAG2447227.1 hypothetical protein HYH02_007967 [Chlamydomonas schloesseri]